MTVKIWKILIGFQIIAKMVLMQEKPVFTYVPRYKKKKN